MWITSHTANRHKYPPPQPTSLPSFNVIYIVPPGGPFQYKDASYKYVNPCYKDKTVPSFILGIPIPGKTVFILQQGPESKGSIELETLTLMIRQSLFYDS